MLFGLTINMHTLVVLYSLQIKDTCREALSGILIFAARVYKNPIVMKEKKEHQVAY